MLHRLRTEIWGYLDMRDVPQPRCSSAHAPRDAARSSRHPSRPPPCIETTDSRRNPSPARFPRRLVLCHHMMSSGVLHRVVALRDLLVVRVVRSFLRQRDASLREKRQCTSTSRSKSWYSVHCSATRNRRQEGDITERGWKRSDCLSLDGISRRYLIRRAGRKGFAVLWSLQSRIRCKSTLYNPFVG